MLVLYAANIQCNMKLSSHNNTEKQKRIDYWLAILSPDMVRESTPEAFRDDVIATIKVTNHLALLLLHQYNHFVENFMAAAIGLSHQASHTLQQCVSYCFGRRCRELPWNIR